jgi:hypothetical protein
MLELCPEFPVAVQGEMGYVCREGAGHEGCRGTGARFIRDVDDARTVLESKAIRGHSPPQS